MKENNQRDATDWLSALLTTPQADKSTHAISFILLGCQFTCFTVQPDEKKDQFVPFLQHSPSKTPQQPPLHLPQCSPSLN